MKEMKIRCEEKLYEIIKSYAKSRGISINQMTIHLLEVGILKIMNQEKTKIPDTKKSTN